MLNKITIIEELIGTASFPGWDVDSLYPLIASKLSRLEFDLLFPYGRESLIHGYQEYLKSTLSNIIKEGLPENIGVTAKIRWMIEKHFEHILKYPEAKHSAISLTAFPTFTLQLSQYVFSLSTLIWQATGDTSTDMRYYTKRISLGFIYVATVLYWHHTNASLEDTMVFFDKRLRDLQTFTSQIKKHIPSPNNIIKNVRLLKQILIKK